jgi:hypothetical protein
MTETGADDLGKDLDYVRRAIDRQKRGGSPASIYYLWAVVVLVGFVLVDFAPWRVPRYWAVAAPAGFVLSFVLGWRSARNAGVRDSGEGRRWMLHWLAMLVGSGFLAIPVFLGAMSWPLFGALAILLSAVSYFHAGVHLDRRMLVIGLLLAGGYVAVLTLPGMVWTVVGVVIALALGLTGFVTRRPLART